MNAEMVSLLAIYAGVGAVAGVLAGLLGIGGGLVIVPMLVYAFTWQGIDQTIIMQAALGTSMASIVFTAWVSTYGGFCAEEHNIWYTGRLVFGSHLFFDIRSKDRYGTAP